jgi:rubrerythrin
MTVSSIGNAGAIELLALNEEAIGRLYETYAGLFAGSADFWLSLARQEQGHAAMLRRFQEQGGDAVAVKRDRFRSAAILLSTRHTEGEIAAARAGELKPVNALSVANALEQSLIESRFFEVFETDSPELKRLLLKLGEDTRAHARTVLERWKEYTRL